MTKHDAPPGKDDKILEKDLAYAEYKMRHAGDLDADLSDWAYNLSRLIATKKKPKMKTAEHHHQSPVQNIPKAEPEIKAPVKKYYIVFHPNDHKNQEWLWETEKFANPEEAFEYAMKEHPIDGFRIVKLIYPKDS